MRCGERLVHHQNQALHCLRWLARTGINAYWRQVWLTLMRRTHISSRCPIKSYHEAVFWVKRQRKHTKSHLQSVLLAHLGARWGCIVFMAQETHICIKPSEIQRKRIVEQLFGTVGLRESDFGQYFAFYAEETCLLRLGLGKQWRNRWQLPISTHEQLVNVVIILKRHSLMGDRDVVRRCIRTELSLLYVDDDKIDEVINLGLRLWLMINFRHPQKKGLGQGRPCVTWQGGCTLEEQLSITFKKSTTDLSASQRRLNPNFKAANMKRVCRMRIE